jgi:hypothetical protein
MMLGHVHACLIDETFVDGAIAIVVDPITGLFFRNGSIAYPPLGTAAGLHPRTRPGADGGSARLGGKPFVNGAIAVVIDAVAGLGHGGSGGTLRPTATRYAYFLAAAYPVFILFLTASDLSGGLFRTCTRAARGNALPKRLAVVGNRGAFIAFDTRLKSTIPPTSERSTQRKASVAPGRIARGIIDAGLTEPFAGNDT